MEKKTKKRKAVATKTHLKRFKLAEVNLLEICVFIVKKDLEEPIKEEIEHQTGRILSVVPANGISHSSMFEVVKTVGEPCIVVFAVARQEDAKKLIEQVSLKFEIYKPGHGRAFAVDVDGYLGAKALFI